MLTRPATIAELDACADVLADAFLEYPWTRWTVAADDHRRRLWSLQRLALQHFGFAAGSVWVTEVAGSIASVAIWTDSTAKTPILDVAPLEGDRHDASTAAALVTVGWAPSEPHHFLGAIGTLPSARRRGLGAATLQPMLDRCDLEGVLAYLETSSVTNVAFYERLGFSVNHHTVIEAGGPDVWGMVRTPR